LKQQGANVILALTHQDFDQDEWLAREFPDVNLIVGGHEHFYIEKKIGNTWITKADADNKSAILHDVHLKSDGGVETSHHKIDLDHTVAKDPLVNAEVDKQLARLSLEFKKQNKDMLQVLGYTKYLLEGVEAAVRGRETALGNFLADTIRDRMKSDIAFTNGGGIRINDNIPPGPITLYDMEGLFYYDNNLVSFELSGSQLLAILNNSISKSGSPYKSMQVVFYQRVTGMGVTNKYLQVNADLVNPIAIAGVRCVHFFWNLDVPGHVSGNLKLL